VTNESDFEILGHVIADHYRAVVNLRAQNTALQAENAQLRQALANASEAGAGRIPAADADD
jgi:regulator of replication initiation timing